jgi:hypothetical protein
VKATRIAPVAAVRDTPLAGAYVRNLNPGIEALRAVSGGSCAAGPALARACSTDADCGGGIACRAGLLAGPGAPLRICDDPLPRAPFELCGDAANAAVQIVTRCEPEGRFASAEELAWQWYVSAGSFDEEEDGFDVGNATGERVVFTPPPGPVTLWLILRDGRGGESWLRRDWR